MRLITQARYALARWAAKGMTWSYTPTWVSRSILNAAFHSLVSQGYARNAAYFACIETHAFTFPEPPLLVWDSDDDSAKPIPNHPLRRLLARPNIDQGEAEFLATAITWMAIGGNCYLHKLRNSRGQVVGLRPYHDGVMRPEPAGDDAESWIARYRFRLANGEEEPVPREDVIHLKWPSVDPSAPWRAQAPILAAAREVDADNEATRYLGALLQNDAIPRTVITQSPQQALTPDEVRRMRAEYQQLHGGDRRGGVAILEAGASIQRLGLNMSELDFSALHDIPEQRICAVLRVPSSVAGLGDDPTYSNSEEAWNRFTRDTRVPLWRAVASEIEADLAADFGGNIAVRFDLRRVAALQEDEGARATRVVSGFTAGLLGFRESRALLGVAELPDAGDLFVSQLARELVPFAQLAAAPIPAPQDTITVLPAPPRPQLTAPADDAPDDEPSETAKARRQTEAKASGLRVARALQRARREVAARMERRVERYFDELAERVVSRAEDAGKAQQKELPALAQLLLPGDETELGGIFRVFTLEILRASWELWNQALDIELAFDESDPAVVASLAQAGDRISGIAQTTRDAVRDLLQFGAGEGWSIDQLVRGTDERPGLRDLVAQTYQGRARTIARTELGTAQQTAAAARYEAAGVRRVLVLDNGVEDSDPRCTELNGTTQTLEWAQANPLQHPNCLRSFAPSFDD
jgi:HK97 family phage portal protein